MTVTSNNTYDIAGNGYRYVNVNVPSSSYSSGSKTFTSNGTYYASSYGYDGFSSVTVNVSSVSYVDVYLVSACDYNGSGGIGISTAQFSKFEILAVSHSNANVLYRYADTYTTSIPIATPQVINTESANTTYKLSQRIRINGSSAVGTSVTIEQTYEFMFIYTSVPTQTANWAGRESKVRLYFR